MNPDDVRVFVFAFTRPDGRIGAVNDKEQRLLLTQSALAARTFAESLAWRIGSTITPVVVDPIQVAQLIRSAHVAADDVTAYIEFIEGDLTDPDDVAFSASEAAYDVPLDGLGDWHAAHSAEGCR